MTRYIDDMTRDELVAEIRDHLRLGVVCHHEVDDPTIVSVPVLRQALRRVRVRALKVLGPAAGEWPLS